MANVPRWGGLRPEPYDPDARDADNDGIVQEGTAWERPAGTRLLDELGRDIQRGATSVSRPRGLQVLDPAGTQVDYTPTYGTAGRAVAPGVTEKWRTQKLGTPSLKDRGLPSLADIVHGPDKPTAAPSVPEPPKVERPATRPVITRGSGATVEATLDRILEDSMSAPWRELTVTDEFGTTHELRRDALSPDENAKMLVAHDVAQIMLADSDLSNSELREFLENTPHGSGVHLDRNGRMVDPTSPNGIKVARDDPAYRELLAERVAMVLVKQWAITSNDSNPTSLFIQDAVQRLFGLEDTIGWDSSVIHDQQQWDADMAKLEESAKVIDAFILAQYQNTQQKLAAAGITELPLYRGMTANPTNPKTELDQLILDAGQAKGAVDSIDVALRPVSSFAYSAEEAENFAGIGPWVNGVVLTGVVPVERIFSTSISGVGCRHEDEITVLGGGTSEFHMRWELRDLGPSQFEASRMSQAIRAAAPAWVDENGYRFSQTLETAEVSGLFLERPDGHIVHIATFATDGSRTDHIPLPDGAPETWTDADWVSIGLDPQARQHVDAAVERIRSQFPPGWEVARADNPYLLSIRVPRTSSWTVGGQDVVLDSVSIADLIDEDDISKIRTDRLDDLVAHRQADYLLRALPQGSGRSAMFEVELTPSVNARGSTWIGMKLVKRDAGGALDYSTGQVVVSAVVTPGGDGRPAVLTVTRLSQTGEWEKVAAFEDPDNFREPDAMRQTIAALTAELNQFVPDGDYAFLNGQGSTTRRVAM